MRIKEISAQTGLTERTIRYYEAQGLIAPRMETKNGRRFRDYSPEDLEDLQTIAALRRAMFTLEEIRSMQDDPDRIPLLLDQYRQRMAQMAVETALLAQASRTLDPADCWDCKALARQLETAARNALAPQHQVEPHFGKYDPETLSDAEKLRLRQDWEGTYANILLYYMENDAQQTTNTRLSPTDLGPTPAQRIGIMKAMREDWDHIWAGVGELPELSGNQRRKEAVEQTKRRLGPGVVVLLAAAIIIGLLLGGYALARRQYDRGFTPNEAISIPRDFYKDHSVMLEQLEAWGVDTAIPCVDGQAAAVLKKKLGENYAGLYDGMKDPIQPGDTVITDFVTVNDSDLGSRMICVQKSGGPEKTIAWGKADVLGLYLSYIRENGLEEQFRAETGMRFSRRNAWKALQTIDRQLYDLGICQARAYPINWYYLKLAVILTCCLLPVAAVFLLALLTFLGQRRAYNAYLKQYNAEGIAHWDEIEGTLPQFTSYAQSGIRGPAPDSKPNLQAAFKAMFLPVKK